MDQPMTKREWNEIWPNIDRNLLRKDWSPGKTTALQMVKYSLELDGPELTSTPNHPESKTEEHRREIASNVESVEKITGKLKSLQLERTSDESEEDDLLMLDFTTSLAKTMPSILEGNYDERLATVMDLSRQTAELLTRKSRRLANLQPEVLAEIMDKKSERGLHGT